MRRCLIVAVIWLMGMGAGAADSKTAPPVTWATTMPSIELSNQPLEKVLNELKVKMPGFNFSISRENVPHDYPVLPAITLENVSLGQFITIVQQQIPGVRITTSGMGTMFPNQEGGGLFCQIYVKPSSTADEATVHVFGLAEIIAYRASLISGTGDHTKQASDDVLSLIQASLDEQNVSPKAEMKLHPATQVLICHITPAQEELIKQVVESLKPKESTQVASIHNELEDLQEKYKRNQNYRDYYEILARTVQAREADKDEEMVKLNAKLEQAKADIAALRRAATQPQK